MSKADARRRRNNRRLLNQWPQHAGEPGIGGEGPPVDSDPPDPVSASVANATPSVIRLTLNEAMDTGFVPAASVFTMGGHTASSLAYADSTHLNITVTPAFVFDEAARTLQHTQAGSNRLRDAAGNLLGNFSLSVSNNVADAGDTTKPLASAAAVSNSAPSVVRLTLNEAMDQAFTPASSAVTISGHTVTGLAYVDGTHIDVTVSAPFVFGEAARTAAYTKPGSNQLRDVAGNQMDNFTGLSITNDVAAVDTTKPTVASRAVADSAPTKVRVTFSEPMTTSDVSAASAFAVSGHTVSSAAWASSTQLDITVTVAFEFGEAARTLGYTKPGGNRLRDVAGNELDAFSSAAITNNVLEEGEPIAAGEWVQLTAPQVLRRITTAPGSSTPAFDPAVAIAFDAVTPTLTDHLPYRSFCTWSQGMPGDFYSHGSLHSNIPMSCIDCLKFANLLSTTFGNSIPHQPHIPPNGPESGYGSGSSQYIYKQYGTPLADPSDWQPYTFHNWTYNNFHPQHGYLLYSVYAVGDGSVLGANPLGEGTQYPQSSAVVYPNPDYRTKGFVRYFKNGKYELVLPSPGELGLYPVAGLSDYCSYRQSMVVLTHTQYDLTVFEMVHGADAYVERDTKSIAAISEGVTGARWWYGKDGNGTVIATLEENKFLIWMTVPTGATPDVPPGDVTTTLDPINYANQIYLLELGDVGQPDTWTRIMLTGGLLSVLTATGVASDGNVSFAIAKAERAVYALAIDGTTNVSNGIITGAVRIFRAAFNDLETWTEVVCTSPPTISHNFGYDKRPLHWSMGHLFLNTGSDGLGSTVHRVKVHDGEIAPLINFYRKDYTAQNYEAPAPFNEGALIAGKHANFARDPVSGKWIQFGGDLVHSAIQSMTQWTVAANDDPADYFIEQILGEMTLALPGFVRPGSPDDGFFGYIGNGKFLVARGGDGFGVVSNEYMAEEYEVPPGTHPGDPGYDAAVARANADRWDQKRLHEFDLATRQFTDLDMESWTVNRGAFGYTVHPGLWEQQYMRNGCYEPSTNTLWRFAAQNMLVAYRLTTQVLDIFTYSRAVIDGTEVFLDGDTPIEGCIVDPSGKFFTDNYNTPPRIHSWLDQKWEHQNTIIDDATGYLYTVAPATGLLWRVDTRGTETNDGDGRHLPMTYIGDRIPLDDRFMLDAARGGWDIKMHTYMFWLAGCHVVIIDDPNGNSGHGHYSFIRRLGFTGAWTPLQLPPDFTCVSFGVAEPANPNNTRVLGVVGHPMTAYAQPNSFYAIEAA